MSAVWLTVGAVLLFDLGFLCGCWWCSRSAWREPERRITTITQAQHSRLVEALRPVTSDTWRD